MLIIKQIQIKLATRFHFLPLSLIKIKLFFMKIWKKGAPSCCWKRMNLSNLSAFGQFSHSVMSDSLWPIDYDMPYFPVCHQLMDLALTHVHWLGDAIQPSHPLLSPFPPTFNLSQHQGLFQWVNSSYQGAKVLEFQLQHQSFQWTLKTDLL